MWRSSAPPPVSTMPRSMTSGRQLRRRPLQHGADRLDDAGQLLLDRLRDLAGVDGDGAGQAGDLSRPRTPMEVSAPVAGPSDRELHLLGGALADEQVVTALDVLRDLIVDAVAGDPHGLAGDDPEHRDHRRLGASPPMSTTMCPRGSRRGSRRRSRPPGAPESGAPACARRPASAASRTARCSTLVTPMGRRSSLPGESG